MIYSCIDTSLDEVPSQMRRRPVLLVSCCHFRKGGASRQANKRLREALEFNPLVPDYLLGRRRMPRQLPPYMGLGDETEAEHYVAEAGLLWLQQEGALDWLRQEVS